MKQTLISLPFLFIALVCQAQITVDIGSKLSAIDTLFRSGEYNEVIDLGNELIQNDIDHTQDTAFNKALVNCGKAAFNLRKYDDAKAFYFEASKNLRTIASLSPSHLVDSYTGLGLCFKRTNLLDSSAYYSNLAISEGIDQLGENNIIYQNSYNNLGNTYRLLGQFSEALDYHEKALFIKTQNYDSTDFRIGDTYNNMALIMHDLYEFGKAKIYYNEALILYEGEGRTLQYRQALVLYNIARIHYDLKDYDLCDKFVNDAMSRMDKLGFDNRAIYFEMLTLQSNSLAETGHFEEARAVLEKTIEKKSKILKDDDLYWNYTYTSGAIVERAVGNFHAAFDYLNQSLRISKLHYDESHPEIINLYGGLADNALSIGDLDLMLQYISEMESRLAKRSELMMVVSKEQELLLYQKYAIYYEAVFDLSGNQAALTSAVSSIEKAMSVLEIVKNSSFEQKARTYIAENHQYLFENALSIYSKKWVQNPSFVEKALQLLDINRNAHLRDAVAQLAALEYNGVPPEIIEEGALLRQQIVNIKESLDDQSEVSISDYENQIQAWENYTSTLAQDFPDYYQQFFSNSSLNFDDLTVHSRTEKLTFVEYYQTAQKLYRFVLNDSGIDVDEVLISKNEISKHIASARSYLYDVSALESLNIELKWLHDHIFKGLENLDQRARIVIIPHGDLQLIPFEMLYDGQDYLVENYAIGYSYALHMWNLNRNQSHSTSGKSFAGFAPSYQISLAQNEDLQNQPISMLLRSEGERLPGALDAVSSIGELVKGKTFVGEYATEEKFKQEANKYGVLHLAVHGLQDEDNPLNSGLLFENTNSFEDGLLTASEVSKMSLSADLAVLSACNSGWGKLDKTEGIQSIGYAFAYAGVPSNVMSLWKVPDASTSQIMKTFYTNLKSGLSKDLALQEAKIKYLQEAVDPAQTHPIYWAGFILNGNAEPISFSSNKSKWWLLIIPALLIAFILYRRNKMNLS